MGLIKTGYVSLTRLLAAHCIIPRFRIFLYRASGINIGKDVYMNLGIIFEDEAEGSMITIGERVAVAKNVTFVAVSHPNNSRLRRFIPDKRGNIKVNEDAWIGTGVVILPGVTIGKASVIGANAVVNRDVEPYSIMAGIPAKKIGDVRERYNVPENISSIDDTLHG